MTDAVRVATSGAEVRLRLRVKPGARQDRLLVSHGGALKLEVRATPERGRANRAVCRLLARALGLAERQVVLVAGATSQDKLVALTGCSAPTVVARLRAAGIDAEAE